MGKCGSFLGSREGVLNLYPDCVLYIIYIVGPVFGQINIFLILIKGKSMLTLFLMS
jgi:hypothetical protein